MTEVSLLNLVQYLDSAVEKVFKPHVTWLALQAQWPNHLVTKIGALGDGFKINFDTVLEVLLSLLCSFVLRGTKVPYCGSSALETAAE